MYFAEQWEDCLDKLVGWFMPETVIVGTRWDCEDVDFWRFSSADVVALWEPLLPFNFNCAKLT